MSDTPKPKRVLSDEQKAKMAEGRKKKALERKKAKEIEKKELAKLKASMKKEEADLKRELKLKEAERKKQIKEQKNSLASSNKIKKENRKAVLQQQLSQLQRSVKPQTEKVSFVDEVIETPPPSPKLSPIPEPEPELELEPEIVAVGTRPLDVEEVKEDIENLKMEVEQNIYDEEEISNEEYKKVFKQESNRIANTLNPKEKAMFRNATKKFDFNLSIEDNIKGMIDHIKTVVAFNIGATQQIKKQAPKKARPRKVAQVVLPKEKEVETNLQRLMRLK